MAPLEGSLHTILPGLVAVDVSRLVAVSFQPIDCILSASSHVHPSVLAVEIFLFYDINNIGFELTLIILLQSS